MSRPVDEKIVALKLDNSNFKRNANESVSMFAKMQSAFGKLKGFNMSSAVNSLGELSRAAGQVDLASLGSNVEGISVKFSAMATVAITALSNITTKAVDAGLALAKSITTDPIMAGFREYEQKMGSIQTILANTAKHGTTLDDVSKSLGDLNEYADKTIYSFGDMTRNIGLFTNAGLELQTSTDMIKGFSNAAAASGAGAGETARAAYQLSQALSQGYVMQMDWMSLSSAGMGNDNMKRDLIALGQAMGTLGRDTEDTMTNWKEALSQDKWLTTDVMSTYLQTMAGELDAAELATIGLTEAQAELLIQNAKTGEEAATKVRTFTQLVGSMAEAVGSGWSETFELIFGDFNEATEMWTGVSEAVGGILDGMATRRNNFLKGFIDAGGRAKVIQIIVNLFTTLKNLISPITEGFAKLFPPSSSKGLVLLVSAVELLTRGLVFLSEIIGGGLTIVFKILKGILDGFMFVIKGIAGVFAMLIPKNLVSNIKKIVDGFKSMGTGIGKFMDAIKNSDELKIIGILLKDLAEIVGSKLVAGLNYGREALTEFSNAITDKIIKYLPTLKEHMSNASKWIKDFAGDAVNSLDKFVLDAGPWLDEFGEKMKEAFGVAKEAVKGFVDNIGPWMGDFWANIKNVFGNAKDAVVQFKDSLSEVADTLWGRFGDVFKFLGSLVKTIWDAITGISFSDILKATTVTGIILYGKKIMDMFGNIKEKYEGLFGGGDGENKVGIIDTLKDSLSNLQTGVNAASLLAIAGSVLMLAGGIKMLEGMDAEDVSRGLGTIAGSLIAMVGSLKVMSGMGTSFLQSLGVFTMLIGLSKALLTFSKAIKNLSDIEPEALGRSLRAVMALLGSVALAVRAMSISPDRIAASATFVVGTAIAIRIMAGALDDIAKIKAGDLVKGLVTLGILLAELAIFTRIAVATGINPVSALGLVIVVGAVKMMVSEIRKISDLKAGEIAKGLITMGLLLLELAVFSRIAAGPGMFTAGAGIAIIAMSIGLLVPVIKELGEMDLKTLGIGLGALAIGLGAMAFAMGSGAGISAGLGIMAVAIAINLLVDPITALGKTDWKVLAIGIGALAVALGVIAGVAYLLSAASVSLVAFGAGLLMVGASFALVGIGMVALSTGLAGLAALTAASIFGLVKVFENLLAVVIIIIPQVVDTFLVLLQSILSSIEENLPSLIESGMNIILAFLEGVASKIEDVTLAAIDVVLGFVDGISEKIDLIVDSAVDLIINFVNALADTMRDEGPRFVDAVLNIVESVLEVVILALLDLIEILFWWIPGVSEATDEMGAKATDALREAFDVGETGRERTGEFVDSVEKSRGAGEKAGRGLGEDTKSGLAGVKGYDTIGGTNVSQYSGGMVNSTGKVTTATRNLASTAKTTLGSVKMDGTGRGAGSQYATGYGSQTEAVKRSGRGLNSAARSSASETSLVQTGKDLAAGLASGISSMADWVGEKARTLANTAKWNVESAMQIMSPSRVMRKDGKYFGEGFGLGIQDMFGYVGKTARNLALNAAESASAYKDKFEEIMVADMNMNPVITPVLDMSEMDLQDLSVRGDIQFNNSTLGASGAILTDYENIRREKEAQFAQMYAGSNDDAIMKAMTRLGERIETLSQSPIHVNVDVDGERVSRAISTPMRKEFDRYSLNKAIIATGRR